MVHAAGVLAGTAAGRGGGGRLCDTSAADASSGRSGLLAAAGAAGSRCAAAGAGRLCGLLGAAAPLPLLLAPASCSSWLGSTPICLRACAARMPPLTILLCC
jgi:hypothetical protein